MDQTLLITFGIIFCCFFCSYTWYSAIYNNFSQTENTSTTANTLLPILILSALGIGILYWILPPQYDQIFSISPLQLGTVIGGCLLTFCGFRLSPKYGLAGLSLSVLANILMLPNDFMFFAGYFPLWLDRLFLLPLWLGFVYAYKYINGLEGIITTQSSFQLIGIIILAFMGALPYFIGASGGIILACITAFAFYNWYPARLKLQNSDCQVLGLLLSGLFILCAQEECLIPIVIFSLYYITDTLWALLKKLSLKPQYQDIQVNTITYQTNLTGLAPSVICENIAKLNTMLLIFGCFQVYVSNQYSLLILGTLLSLWFLQHLLDWQTPTQSFSEINKEVISDIKKNVKQLRKKNSKDE